MENAIPKQPSSAKKIRVAAIACIAAGVLMFVAGWVMGANFGLYIDNTGLRFVNEHTFLLSAGDLGGVGQTPFTSVNINSNIANVEITAGGEFSAELFTQYNNVTFTHSIERNTLFIDVEMPPTFLLPIGFTPVESRLTVNIPSYWALNIITVNNVNNNTSVKNLTAADLFISSANGDVTVSGTQSEHAFIYLRYGNGTFDNLNFGLLEFQTVHGTGRFSNGTFTEVFAGSEHGALYFANCQTELFNIISPHGRITAEQITVQQLYVMSVTGEITVSGRFNGAAEFSNGSGPTTVIVFGSEADFTYNIGTRGAVVINGQPSANIVADRGAQANHLKITCRTGDIWVTFTDDI